MNILIEGHACPDLSLQYHVCTLKHFMHLVQIKISLMGGQIVLVASPALAQIVATRHRVNHEVHILDGDYFLSCFLSFLQ